MKYDSMEYEMPFRENFEFRIVMVWALTVVIAFVFTKYSNMPDAPFYWLMAIAFGMSSVTIRPAFRLYRLQRNLKGRKLEFITLEKLIKQVKKKTKKAKKGSQELELWWGKGFNWENRHAQRAFEVLKGDISNVTGKVKGKLDKHQKGQRWIHGLEPKEYDIEQPLSHTEGHVLITGTTGSGKTRLFDLIISQAIMRNNEAVIIIDPKGDKELRDNARRCCEAMEQPERFVCFHPAFPEDSARIDPLYNFNRGTEPASRIAALIPSETGADPFKAFGQMALNNVTQGLLIIDEKPTIKALRHYLEGGVDSLVIRAITTYAEKVLPQWSDMVEPYVKRNMKEETKALALIRFYREQIQEDFQNSDLEGLIVMFEHDRAHFSKMVASLLPILSMLTSGDLGALLSPDPEDTSDNRIITDSADIINKKLVCYIGLDSLSDAMVGSAIGSIILSDLASVAGDRYNYGVENYPVNVFVDEAAEVLNKPTIQLLNKARGAGFRLLAATQTISDFIARLGSKDQAYQVLGNINNLISLRVTDNDTQKYLMENLPTTRIKYVMRTQGQTTSGGDPSTFTGNQGERLMEEEVELFNPQLLGMMPDLEFIAKISGGFVFKGRLPILKD